MCFSRSAPRSDFSRRQRLVNILKGRKGYREFTPLNDISFEINEGDFFGIVGRNGSGKSTLLKTIAGIYAPNKGLVQVNGTLVPFIELGVGFNPELSGRENIFLNGALLGFSHDETEAMYDDIVDFAELGDFMEERLKNYSSGMQVRLAFSIAIKAQGDILLLDEVLAVGDEAFQKKCASYFENLKRQKKTVILVTHDMAAVEKFCTRALMLEDGKVVKIGKPSGVAKLYAASNQDNYLASKRAADDKKMKLIKNGVTYELTNEDGLATNKFNFGQELTARITWKSDSVRNIGLALLSQSGEYVYGTNTVIDKYRVSDKTISYKLKLNIGSGDYIFTIGLFGNGLKDEIDFIEDGPSFIVVQPSEQQWGGITQLSSRWGE